MRAAFRPVAPAGVSLRVMPPQVPGPRVSRPFVPPGSIDTFESCAKPALRHPLSRRLDSAHFRRVYHQNQWPSLGRFRSLTGTVPEHRIWLNTAKGAPLATAFNSLARVAADWAVVPLLVGGVISSLFFGMRKGFHNTISNRRALAASQRPLPSVGAPASLEMQRERACGLRAIKRLRNQERWRARMALISVGGLAPLAATMNTINFFFKPAILGHLVPALAAATWPLSIATMPVLAGGAFLTGAFDLVGVYRLGPVQRRLDAATLEPWLGLEDQVLGMARLRMREVRKYGLYCGVASLGVALGAPLTLAFGPVGLSVLLPSILATVWLAYERTNHTEYKNTFSDEQKLALGTPHDVCNEVMCAQHHYEAFKELKANRRTYYPYAADSPVGFATRLWAWTRRHTWAQPERPRWDTARDTVLEYWSEHLAIEAAYQQNRLLLVRQELARPTQSDRFAELSAEQEAALAALRQGDGMRAVVQDIKQGVPDVAEVVDHLHGLMEDSGLLRAFGAQLLGDRALREVFDARGFEHERRNWSVDPELIEDTLEHQLDADTQGFVLQRYWRHAEEVLLKRGKRRSRDRVRELLDYLTMALDIQMCNSGAA